MITITGRTALITGSSRGIGRGIALKLAECGVNRIGVHYFKNRTAADDTANKLRERGAEPLLIQADVTKVDDIARMFATVRESFGSLDIFVSNARPEIEHFYQPVMEIPLENWQTAFHLRVRPCSGGRSRVSRPHLRQHWIAGSGY
jgi:NAD(P)-dependent dehydrogenase (short-subunit alcohol dehydrogenase family)